MAVSMARASGSPEGTLPVDALEPRLQFRAPIHANRPCNGIDGMYVQNDTIGQHGMHGRFDRSAKSLAACDCALTGGIGVLIDTLPRLLQIHRDEDLVLRGVREPFAGSLDPENAVQLDRSVAGAGLNKQGFTADARRNFQQGVDFRY
jgi:hypothetical protein